MVHVFTSYMYLSPFELMHDAKCAKQELEVAYGKWLIQASTKHTHARA